MEAKEKAKELIERFIEYTNGVEGLSSKYDDSVAYRNGVECSLVLVEELITATSKPYWYDVKRELSYIKNNDTDYDNEYPLIED
jgi:hypothetical protein